MRKEQELADEQQVHQALRRVKHPESGRSLMELGMIRDIRVDDRQVRFTVALPFMNVPIKDQIVSEARAAVEGLPEVEKVDVELAEMTQQERARFMAAQEKRVGLAERFNH
nr:iron-sulfur cluster assembly protein [Anaerolineae bacterium]